jgi:hypothetical protein
MEREERRGEGKRRGRHLVYHEENVSLGSTLCPQPAQVVLSVHGKEREEYDDERAGKIESSVIERCRH